MHATSKATINCLAASVQEMLGDLEENDKLVLLPKLDDDGRLAGWKIVCAQCDWPISPLSHSRPYFDATPVCEFKPTVDPDDTPWTLGGIQDHMTEAISMAGYHEATESIREIEALMITEIRPMTEED